MDEPQQIEQQFNFQYPALYHRLYVDGMLDWGALGPDWITQIYPGLRKQPPLLLFAHDFELMHVKDIGSQLEEFREPGYWMYIDPQHLFVPFARNGAGDWYCFYISGQQGEDIPIVLLWHDADRAGYKAHNLQDFIFRSMLEAVADIEEAAFGLLDEENFSTDMQNILRTHSKYLSPKQQAIVTGIYQRPARNKPLISEQQLTGILENEIGLEHLGKTFAYRRQETDIATTADNKRRVGTLMIRVCPAPKPHDNIYTLLKALNWRQKKVDDAGGLELYRKESVIFGLPSMDTVDGTFRDQLVLIKSSFPNVEILYQENETSVIYKL